MSDIRIRDLTTIDEYRQVIELEKAIWGYTDPGDLVTVPVFCYTVHRGATLLGAFDGDRMIGFAYAVPGMKDRKPMHWSHMAGVLAEYRGGLGYQLKLAQRERAMAQGIDLIEWTFDPLQTMNAHFNFAKLGGVSDEYAANFYGESTSALHKGTPTDRLVLSWKITDPHVTRHLTAGRATPADPAPTGDHVGIEIPMGFTEMQQQQPALALEWRLKTRAQFQDYFGRGYRAVDFVLQRDSGFGRYLLARD